MKEAIKQYLAILPEKFINPREMVTLVGRNYVHIYNIETAKSRKETIAHFFAHIPACYRMLGE